MNADILSEAQTSGVFHRLTAPAIRFIRFVFYRLLGGSISSRVKEKQHSQHSYLIEISDEVEDSSASVMYMYTIKRMQSFFADNQFKTLSDYKYKIKTNFKFTRACPNKRALVAQCAKFVVLNPHSDRSKENAEDLLGNGWIVDEAVNKYMDYLCHKNKGVYAISSECNQYNQPDFATRLLHNRPEYYANLKLLAPKAKTLLWPMCDNTHWYLILIKKQPSGMYNIYCIDSLNSSDRKQYLHKAERTLAALFPNQDPKKLIGKKECINIPVQSRGVEGSIPKTNYTDCGPAICYWATQFAKGVDINAIPHQGVCDYSAFRVDIAQKLIEDNNKPRSIPTITLD